MRKFKFSYAFFVLLLTFSSVHLLHAQEASGKPYDKELRQINEYLKVGNISDALYGLEDIIQKYPDAADVLYAQGMLFGQMNNIEGAIESAKKAYEISKNIEYAKYLYTLYYQKDKALALQFMNAVLADHPDNPDAWQQKVILLHEDGRSEEALRIIEEGKDKIGDREKLTLLEADILLDLGQRKKAEKILKKHTQAKTQVTPFYSSYAFSLNKRGKFKKAIQVLEQGLKNTNDEKLYLDLADLYDQQNQNNKSYTYLKLAFESEKVDYGAKRFAMRNLIDRPAQSYSAQERLFLADILTRLYGNIPESYFFKGEIYLSMQDMAMAKTMFSKVVTLDKRHVEAWRILIQIELMDGNTKTASQVGLKSLQDNPNHPMLSYFTGITYLMDSDYEEARKHLENALDHSVKSPEYLKSEIYGALGDLYHAIELHEVSDVAYEEAIALDSTNLTALNNYAYYLSIREEKLELAKKYSLLANELSPDNSTFQDTYAWVLYKNEEMEEALIWIEKAIKNSGTAPSATLLDHYGDILYSIGKEKEGLTQWQKALALAELGEEETHQLKEKIKRADYE